MRLTITFGQLDAARDALRRLSEAPLPVKTAYSVAKLCRLAEPELQFFFEKRLALARELGEERTATEAEQQQGFPRTVWEVPEGKRLAFDERLDALRSHEITLDWRAIALDDLGAHTMSATDVDALGPLLIVGDSLTYVPKAEKGEPKPPQ